MPRGDLRIVVQREILCSRCQQQLVYTKDGLIIWVEPCPRCSGAKASNGPKS